MTVDPPSAVLPDDVRGYRETSSDNVDRGSRLADLDGRNLPISHDSLQQGTISGVEVMIGA